MKKYLFNGLEEFYALQIAENTTVIEVVQIVGDNLLLECRRTDTGLFMLFENNLKMDCSFGDYMCRGVQSGELGFVSEEDFNKNFKEVKQ
jgi:hypothetical protein